MSNNGLQSTSTQTHTHTQNAVYQRFFFSLLFAVCCSSTFIGVFIVRPINLGQHEKKNKQTKNCARIFFLFLFSLFQSKIWIVRGCKEYPVKVDWSRRWGGGGEKSLNGLLNEHKPWTRCRARTRFPIYVSARETTNGEIKKWHQRSD